MEVCRSPSDNTVHTILTAECYESQAFTGNSRTERLNVGQSPSRYRDHGGLGSCCCDCLLYHLSVRYKWSVSACKKGIIYG